MMSKPGNHHRFWNGSLAYITDKGNNYSAYAADGDSHPTAAGLQKASVEFAGLLNSAYNWWQQTSGQN